MPNLSKSRPVDALFGDDNARALPTYIVEPAQPVTTVAPPPLDAMPPSAPVIPAEVAPTPPARAVAPPPPSPVPPSTPVIPADVAPTPPAWAVAPPPLNRVPSNAPVIPADVVPPVPEPGVPTPEPIIVPRAQARAFEDRFTPLAERIERLYGEVKMDLHDSKVATEFCFGLLMQARQAVEARDYARAEFCIQSVDAKLKRSQRSMKASFGFGVILLTLWELIALVVGGGLLVLTYVVNLTLFGLPVVGELVVLLRALGWGMIGGGFGALFNLPWFIQFREYDPAYALNYLLRPFVGALHGAILFLISQTGLLAGNLLVGDLTGGPVFVYVLAVLAGFKQEYVGEFLDGVMRAIFRPPRPPMAK